MLIACGDDTPILEPTGPEGGVLRFDAAMLGGDASLEIPRDAGPRDAGPRDAGPRDAGPDDGGTSNATDRRYFVPPIEMTYVGMRPDPGISHVAWTVVDDGLYGAEFLFAIRNTYGSPLCGINVRLTFLDADGDVIATGDDSAETGPMRGCYGSCGLVPGCLAPGLVGMGQAILDLYPGRTVDEIARATFDVSALNLVDAVAATDVVVRDLTSVPGSITGQRRVTGRVVNLSPALVRNPDVTVFGVNAVGRPLFHTWDIELLTIPVGGSWSFEATPAFEGDYASLTWFLDVDD